MILRRILALRSRARIGGVSWQLYSAAPYDVRGRCHALSRGRLIDFALEEIVECGTHRGDRGQFADL